MTNRKDAIHRWANWNTAVLAFVLTLVTLSASAAAAQTSANGSIRGHVVDASGGALVGVQIIAHSPYVGGTFKAVSDAEGNYRLTDLPTNSEYTLTAEHEGFSKFEHAGLVVRAGLNVTLDVSLKVGSEKTLVEVSGDPPLIDLQSTEQAVNLSGELVREIPIAARREWSDALQVTPGIISASADAQGGQTYFLRGSENENHATLLNGFDIGAFSQNWPSNYISISTEALSDIQIKTGGQEASSPAAMGMVINLSTASGGDQFHGSASVEYQPLALNANNTPGGASAASKSLQPDFSASGPIKKGRAWFFGSGRYIHRDDGISNTALQLSELSNVEPGYAPFSNLSRGFVYVANSTINLTDKHSLFGIVQYDSRTQGANFQYYAGNYAPSQYGGAMYGVKLTSLWSSNLTTRLLASYNNKGGNTSLGKIGGVPLSPEIDVYGSATYSGSGTITGVGQASVLNGLSTKSVSPAHKNTIAGDLTYYIPNKLGSHEIETGYYLQPKMAEKSTTYYANGGVGSLQSAVLNTPNDYTSGYKVFATTSYAVPTREAFYVGASDYAYYVQDKWRPVPRLSITAGLRADHISGQDLLWKTTVEDSWNYAPRAGGAFVLTKNQKNVIRASWAKLTDIPNESYIGTAATASVTSAISYVEKNGTTQTFVTPGATSANKIIDPHRHQGYSQQWLVGYRTQLPGQVTFDASLVNVDYKDRPAEVDQNQIYTVNAATGNTVWSGLRNPAYNNVYYITNNKWNWFAYHGVEFTATKETKKIQAISTYTYAWYHIAGTWQPDDVAGMLQPTTFANNQGLGTVRGWTTSSYTSDGRDRMWQHNQWRNAITWKAPWKLRLSTSLTAQSGTPTGPVTTNLTTPYNTAYGPASLKIGGRTVANPLATTYRFPYANRGEGQVYCPWLTSWSARAGREFRITEKTAVEVVGDFFNITNRGAGQQPVTAAINSANFGQMQNIQLPRSAQFSARYRF
jgi:hypothetical protein